MQTDDLTLQDLIVRALTSRDGSARKSLERAAAHDPELQKFCAELEGLVEAIGGAKDWRNEKPSAELTQRIREAVVSKLPAAPPHFRTVMMESDLGQQKASRSTLFFLVLVVLAIAALVLASMVLRNNTGTERLTLKGQPVYEAPWNDNAPTALAQWQAVRGGAWKSSAVGVVSGTEEEAGVLLYKEALKAVGGMAFSIDVKVPPLDEKSSVGIFLAESATGAPPAFDLTGRNERALALDILPDGLQLMAPGNTMLASRAVSNARGGFYRVRIEHLGAYARVTINNEVYFDGPLAVPLRGTVYPGLRATGPKRNETIFNNARIER